jgi:hypothetical protein
MHPYFLDRLAQDHWDSLGRLAAADATARRIRRSRRAVRAHPRRRQPDC